MAFEHSIWDERGHNPESQGLADDDSEHDVAEEPSQEIVKSGTRKRAKWSHEVKLFLIRLLKDHDVPGFRTQNAWSKEAWTNIGSSRHDLPSSDAALVVLLAPGARGEAAEAAALGAGVAQAPGPRATSGGGETVRGQRTAASGEAAAAAAPAPAREASRGGRGSGPRVLPRCAYPRARNRRAAAVLLDAEREVGVEPRRVASTTNRARGGSAGAGAREGGGIGGGAGAAGGSATRRWVAGAGAGRGGAGGGTTRRGGARARAGQDRDDAGDLRRGSRRRGGVGGGGGKRCAELLESV
ncbi:hypothetical protein EJB05_52253, partial [Eragrostis curvula]